MSADVDRLVEQLVGWITTASRRAGRVALMILIAVALAAGAGFWLGLAALSGGIRTMWIIIGGAFLVLSVGSALVAWWRVSSVQRHVPEIESDVRTLLSNANDHSRTVVEAIVVDRDGDGSFDRPDGASARVIGREVTQFRDMIGPGVETSARITSALTAMTSFPLLLAVAAFVGFVFVGFAIVFLLALAIG